MAEIADRNILPDIELKVAASSRHNECAFNRRRSDQISVHDALYVLGHGISVIARLGKRRVFAGSQQNRVRAVDAHEP